MMHEIQSFAPVSFDRWRKIKAAILARTGVDINSDKGEAAARGAKVSYEFDAATQTLTIQTLEKPFLVPEYEMDQLIHSFIEGVR